MGIFRTIFLTVFCCLLFYVGLEVSAKGVALLDPYLQAVGAFFGLASVYIAYDAADQAITRSWEDWDE